MYLIDFIFFRKVWKELRRDLVCCLVCGFIDIGLNVMFFIISVFSVFCL